LFIKEHVSEKRAIRHMSVMGIDAAAVSAFLLLDFAELF
jgi:hypothetical protein